MNSVQIASQPVEKSCLNPWYQNQAMMGKISCIALASLAVVGGVFFSISLMNYASGGVGNLSYGFLMICGRALMRDPIGYLMIISVIASVALATLVPYALLEKVFSIIDWTNPKEVEEVRKQVQKMDLKIILDQFSLEKIMKYNLLDKDAFNQKYQEMVQEERLLELEYLQVLKKESENPLSCSSQIVDLRILLRSCKNRREAVDSKIQSQYMNLRQKYPEH